MLRDLQKRVNRGTSEADKTAHATEGEPSEPGEGEENDGHEDEASLRHRERAKALAGEQREVVEMTRTLMERTKPQDEPAPAEGPEGDAKDD